MAAAIGTLPLALAALFGPASAGAEIVSFSPGPEQTFVVPSGVTHITVAAIGDTGGEGTCHELPCSPGKGEKVGAKLSVKPGQKLYVDFAGGGAATFPAGAGGNAADLRTISSTEAGSLASRILVAGGGGGAGEGEEASLSLFPGSGGNAGSSAGEAGLTGKPAGGQTGGGGGTQSKGGSGGAGSAGMAGEAGALGQGGKGGKRELEAGSGGGGGGGYYGGGGGGAGASVGAGGGGGSSFVEAGAEEVSYALNSAEAPAGITITYAGGAETVSFSPGAEQSFLVPLGVAHIQVVAVGENGGELTCGDGVPCAGGAGERVAATIAVTHGQKLYADFVGGGTATYPASEGGNSADLRTKSSAEAGSLSSRLVVAGGGGGAGEGEEESYSLFPGSGGNAGSSSGVTGTNGEPADGQTGGGGGTQSKGGNGGTGSAGSAGESGQLGQGGKGGKRELEAGSGGGGGGGYYGGGGGGAGPTSGAGGGGGSSFVATGAEEVSYTVNTAKVPAGLSITYRSAAPPSVSITTPAEGAIYDPGQSVTASFTCTDGSGGPGLKPGTEGCSGTVANGAAIETSTPGEHHFTVTATSNDGLTASKTVTYTVASPPTVSITAPANGATYLEGQTVDASYSCAEGAGGPGLKPGTEGCGGTVANGAAIATSPAGEHEFTVTARSTDGQSTSKTISYTVVAPPVFGRCLKVAGTGLFKNATCTKKLASATGAYEWVPGPGPKPGFSLALKSGSKLKLESAAKKSLVCTGASGHGSVTGLNTVNFEELTFTGCSDGGEKCTNTGLEGEVMFTYYSNLTGSLGWSNKASKKLDLKLAPSSFLLSAYACPSLEPRAKEVYIGASGILLAVALNKLSTNATDKFAEKKGKQVPDALEGEEPLAFEWERINESPRTETIEGVGLKATMLQTYEEGYEINSSF